MVVQLNETKNKKIQEAIERRQADLEFNKKRMIDSVMEREFRKINIDRIVVKDVDNREILITDENQIMDEVNKHFQTCAGTINQDKPIPQEWANEYSPQHHIDASIYDSTVHDIT